MKVLKLLWVFIDTVVCKCHSDNGNALFRFFIDRILFRVLSDRVLFESSVMQSSSEFAVIDSSLGSSIHFFSHVAIFCQIVLPFFIKNGCFVLRSLYFQKHFNVFKQLQQHWSRKIEWKEAVVRRCSAKTVFHWKTPFPESLFYNFADLRPATLLKKRGLRPATLLTKRLWHRRFPVNFAKFLRTPFLTEHIWWLLLDEERHDKDTKDTKYYIGNICQQFPDLHLTLI